MRVTGSPGGFAPQGQNCYGPAHVGLGEVVSRRNPALEVANRLRDELARYGIAAEVYVGHGMAFGVAVLSVGPDLLVWVEPGPGGCWNYVWWTGRINPATGRRIYSRCPWSGVSSVARRVATRHRELHGRYDRPPSSAERQIRPVVGARHPAGSTEHGETRHHPPLGAFSDRRQ